MKNITKPVIIIIGVMGLTFAPIILASATSAASATIISLISIAKTVDMHFGNIAISASASGTVVLSPTGLRTTGGSGGVTLPSNTGPVAPAEFTITGEPGFTYSITLPVSATLSDGGSHTMNISSFTSNPSATGTLNSAGTQTLQIGATLNISAAQPAGSYRNSTAVPVTVNYN